MPDIKILTIEDGVTTINIPKYNDSSTGIYALAQTAALMMLDPNHGNLMTLLKTRVDNSQIEEMILRSVDNVEQALMDEQSNGTIPDNETLSQLDINSIVINGSNVIINLSIINLLNEQTTLTI